jgi:hypothetical protein
MDHFAGLDVSVKETSVCIVDDTGRIVKEVKVASEPQTLLKVLGNPAYRFKRIGLEAGPLSQWLFNGLAEAGLPVVCVERRRPRVIGHLHHSAHTKCAQSGVVEGGGTADVCDSNAGVVNHCALFNP